MRRSNERALSAGDENGGGRHGRRALRPRVRRIGSRRIIAEGLEGNLWKDVYFNAMTASWPAFIAALAAAFVVLNLVFALLYAGSAGAIANAHPGNLADLFFFSVETITTLGYGEMYPQTTYGHLVSATESFTGLMLLATMTGLVFARISRPRARIIFARNAVVAPHDGVPTLMIRMANARSNFISEATAKTWMIGPTVSQEGRRFVGFQPMRLIKSENPTLALSWILFHPIDADSPLFGMTEETLAESEINFVVSVVGFDETSGQTVHARDVFAAQDVRFGHEYEDIVWIDDHGLRHIDYSKIDSTRPARPPVESVDSVG
jgi:inward rectifier potassium channel